MLVLLLTTLKPVDHGPEQSNDEEHNVQIEDDTVEEHDVQMGDDASGEHDVQMSDGDYHQEDVQSADGSSEEEIVQPASAESTGVLRCHAGWTMAEHNYLFELIEAKLQLVRRPMTLSEFKPIEQAMTARFEGRWVTVGDPLTTRATSKNPIRQAAVAGSDWPYRIRNYQALHTYATKTDSKAAREYHNLLKKYPMEVQY